MKILFLCTGNSCRSQMAEGLAKTLGPKAWEFKSAGTFPVGVNPHTVESMNEIGIDISSHTSKRVDEKMVAWADHVITLCDSAKGCVIIPSSKKATHWSIPDPVGTVGDETRILKSFAKTRDIIRGHLEEFFRSLNPPQPPFAKGGSSKIVPPLKKGGKGGFSTQPKK